FLRITPHPIAPLFPYTTLFRSPSAARAIFTAVFWKPAIRWHVQRIEVLKPIRWTSVRRNEIGKVASPSSEGILIEDERQQRAGLDRKSTRLNSSHVKISYAVVC